MNSPVGKYIPFKGVKLEDRQWPNKVTTQAPTWCSVCLRDGNQSLAVPMTVEQKLELFKLLVGIGFKEIEVGFPAASDTEYQFVRRLIEENLIPEDVTIQVLVQAREELISTTCQALRGAKKAIIHLYNSTSPAQRRIVFNMTKEEVAAMAVRGTNWVKQYSQGLTGTEVMFQYSPESFSATETDYAIRVCEAVMMEWEPTSRRKIILNLPETVEVATPNVYADQIEYFCKNMMFRDCAIISVHAHNDRGTGVAATELAMLAGADRVEGTLFGNGERTGNTDIIAIALNLYTQGIDPKLDFSNLDYIREVYERCTGMKVPPRQPYSGELVFTAFSGSHQDAIRKGLKAMSVEEVSGVTIPVWDVPYLLMDPTDVGRKYEEVIRVNGQSGKGGIAHLLETGFGIRMPKDMEREFGAIAGKQIDARKCEATANDLAEMFKKEYIEREDPYKLISLNATNDARGYYCQPVVKFGDRKRNLTGTGNGPIAAFVHAMQGAEIKIHVLDQAQHALGEGEDATAIGYIKLQLPDGSACWGAGLDTNIELASIKAVISALNRWAKS